MAEQNTAPLLRHDPGCHMPQPTRCCLAQSNSHIKWECHPTGAPNLPLHPGEPQKAREKSTSANSSKFKKIMYLRSASNVTQPAPRHLRVVEGAGHYWYSPYRQTLHRSLLSIFTHKQKLVIYLNTI